MVTRSLQSGLLTILGALLLHSQWVCAQSPAAPAAGPEASHWQSVAPGDVGLLTSHLDAIDSDISNGRYGFVDSLMVIRGGKIAYERYYPHDYSAIYAVEARTPGPLVVTSPSGPYNYFNAFWHPYYKDTDLHSMQSVTKSIVSAVIGIAIERGDFPDLDTPVLSFFEKGTVAAVDAQKRSMTLRDLLTMSAGWQWDEDVPYSDPSNTFAVMAKSRDWVQYTLDQPMVRAPGTAFKYNSGATLVLGQIFLQATGIDIEEYTVRHLFEPLGIERYEWKRTPLGLADTQEGLFLSTRDLAKIAWLFREEGVWQGRPVVPAPWVRASLAPSFEVNADGSEGYGYKWWSQAYSHNGEDYVAYLGKGFGGQRPIILPEFDMVIVLTGWNILPDRPFFTASEAIARVLAAVAP
ncbi:MAG: beta-lactamase family protein [Luminiphilus sp.]|nr:beta-lactamase family protein [Luminiphilus sp.]